MADPSDSALDRIYGLPLEEFTNARNDAAKELDAAGEGEAAAEVKAARKPTRPAWIVNTLARQQSKKIESLLKAGERLREAQDKVIAGEAEPDQLRITAAAERREIDALLELAGKLAGASASALDRVGETLQAASRDPELAEVIRAGRLDRQRVATSLGLLGTAAPAPSAGSMKKKKAGGGGGEGEDRAVKRREAAEKRKAERRVAAGERSLERARDLAGTAEQAFQERRERVAELERDLAEARAELEKLS